MSKPQRSVQWSFVSLVLALAACTPPTPLMVNVDETSGLLTANVGAEGGVIVAESSDTYRRFGISVPAGAVPPATTITVSLVQDDTGLPENAFRVGQQFKLEASAPLSKPVTVGLPVDLAARTGAGGEAQDVKVWVREGEGWRLVEPVATSEGVVFIEVSAFTTMAAGVRSLATNITTCVNCPAVQLFEPAVGRAPAPCTISGGFCLEPLTGGSTLPAPAPKDIGMHVRNGRVTYRDSTQDNHLIQIRLSDLALFHTQGALNLGSAVQTGSNANGALFSGGRIMTVLPIGNAASAPRSIPNGGPSAEFVRSPSSTSARAVSATQMRDIDAAGNASANLTRNVTNHLTLLGEDVTPGASWVLTAAATPTSATGPVAGIVQRVNAAGAVDLSIQDLASPQLLVGACAGGSGGFGDSLSCGLGFSGVFASNATRLVTRGAAGASPRPLLMADLSAATPVLTALNITAPTAPSGGDFQNVALDAQGRVWFIFGTITASGLFVFDPATSTTQAVPLANFNPRQIAVDGNSVIVFARSTQSASSQIFRVRSFGQ